VDVTDEKDMWIFNNRSLVFGFGLFFLGGSGSLGGSTTSKPDSRNENEKTNFWRRVSVCSVKPFSFSFTKTFNMTPTPIALFHEKMTVLNKNFLTFATQELNKYPAADLTPTMKSYLRHVAEFDNMYAPASSKSVVEEEAGSAEKNHAVEEEAGSAEHVETITGEEGESNLLNVPCKFYIFDGEAKIRQERGMGTLRLTRASNTGITELLVARLAFTESV